LAAKLQLIDDEVDETEMDAFLKQCGLEIIDANGAEIFSPPAKKRLFSQTRAHLKVCNINLLILFDP